MSNQSPIDRREFMRAVAGASVAAPLAVCHAAAGAPGRKPGFRRLGRTGLDVSIVSLGGHAAYRAHVVAAAIDKGINFVHTSPFYCRGVGMRTFGEVLRRYRSKVHLAVKIQPDVKLVDRCLQVMHTDHIDLIMPGIQSMAALRRAEDYAEEFEKRKKEGKARFFGMACHASIPKVVGKALEMDCFDVVMICYNLANRKAMEPLLAEAARRDVGIIGMKSWRSAGGADPEAPAPAKTAKTVGELLREKRVATILRGIESMEDVDAFTAILHEKVGRADPGVRAQEQVVAARVCGVCGACEPCPAGVRVQDILRYVQYAVDANEAHSQYAPQAYARLRPSHSFDACRGCGACEAACPKGLPVRQQLAQAHRTLTCGRA